MADINKELQKIAEARFGHDVRDAIHDSIRDINDEVEGQRSIINASLEQAQASANQAEQSAISASSSATSASNSATSAEQSATSASNSANQAQIYAERAEQAPAIVTANPSSEATDNLNKVQIGDTTYIVSGGGVNPAPLFNENNSYKKGDYVTYDGNTYRFKSDKTAGTWDSTKVKQQYAMGAYVTAGKKANTTLGDGATAEGIFTTASNDYAHAEGYYTVASAEYTHAEGYFATASGQASHAEGKDTTASGQYSHAEGEWTKAIDSNSHAEGYRTQTGRSYQHVQGICNIGKNNTLFEIGNGSYDISTQTTTRSNAFEVDFDGNVTASGMVYSKIDIITPSISDKISQSSISVKRVGNIVSVSGWFVTGSQGIEHHQPLFSELPVSAQEIYDMVLVGDDDTASSVYMFENQGIINTLRTLPANTSVNLHVQYICK